jgi:nitric oxide reductase NorQ protein
MSVLSDKLSEELEDTDLDAEPHDPLFDPLAGVVEDPAAAAAAGVTPSKKKAQSAVPASRKSRSKAPSAAASAVRGALQVIDPTLEDEVRAEAEQPRVEKQKRVRTEAEAIKRANGDLYYPRILSEDLTDVESLAICRERDIRILLYGFPGCGKTALCEAAYGEELVVVNGHSDTEVSDFVGTYVPKPSGGYEWIDGPLVIAMREGRPLLIDDATLIAPGVIARVYPAMDGRRVIYLREHEGEEIKAKEGFFIIAAHNPNAPGAILSEALASRFAVHIHVESDLKMALRMGVNDMAVKVAAHLRKMRDEGDGFGWAPEMRELLDFSRVEEAFGEFTAVQNLVSTAPAEAREEVIKVLRTWQPGADALTLKGEAHDGKGA